MLNSTKIRVIYADTDAMGIVYHTNYIKWFEIGRTELFRDLGIVFSEWEGEGVSFPLTRAYCHYLQPARYDDLLWIDTEIEYLRRASIKFRSVVRNEKRSQVLAAGYTVHACLDREGRIVRIPRRMAEMIAKGINTKTGDNYGK
ncbi:MAG TPA: thioesterase family protein [Syntrophales bacterium]|nr:thioesterase family protein [Syntrophales bacterium]HON23802.1 thioesterase family protein [Syntrophales bacterium]HOU76652.1 thioesterase family protein [Syntrophales bacterium]HPC31409.1 thioesterase family protein [Syntrophales bacterium]HQG33315.1 thioesterase family protein [Syntrophales bacterium]